MKVRCRLCEHEKNGFCSKKGSPQKPVKIELNKPRSCGLFKEDGLRILQDYRKREAHKTNVKQIQQKNLTVFHEVQRVQAELAKRRAGLTIEDPTPPTTEVEDGQV